MRNLILHASIDKNHTKTIFQQVLTALHVIPDVQKARKRYQYLSQ